MCSPYPRCPSEYEYTSAVPKWEFEGDPDIAGTGVITSFLVSAIFTNLVAFYAFFFADGIVSDGYYSKLDLLMRRKTQYLVNFTTKWCINPLWEKLSSYIPSSFRRLCRKIWNNRVLGIRPERLHPICLQLADMQLITGASILIVLYATHCSITQYHFYIGSQLAYLSFLTFQATFMTISGYLQTSLSRRLWRYLWVLVLFGAIFPTRILAWNNYFLIWDLYGASVQCSLDKITEGWDTKSTVFAAFECFTLFWSFCWITVSLFPDLLNFSLFIQLERFIFWLFSWPFRYLLRAQSPNQSARKKIFWTIILFIIIPCRHFLRSETFSLLVMYVTVIRATNDMMFTRAEAAYQGRQGDESEWGFGQVLPVLLLVIPLSQFMDELWRSNDAPSIGSNHSTEQRPSSSHTIAGHNREYYELAVVSNPNELGRSWTIPSRASHLARTQIELSWTPRTDATYRVLSSDARVLTAEEKWQDKLDQLEDSFFENPIFQAWVVILFFSVFAIFTWVGIEFGLPI